MEGHHHGNRGRRKNQLQRNHGESAMEGRARTDVIALISTLQRNHGESAMEGSGGGDAGSRRSGFNETMANPPWKVKTKECRIPTLITLQRNHGESAMEGRSSKINQIERRELQRNHGESAMEGLRGQRCRRWQFAASTKPWRIRHGRPELARDPPAEQIASTKPWRIRHGRGWMERRAWRRRSGFNETMANPPWKAVDRYAVHPCNGCFNETMANPPWKARASRRDWCRKPSFNETMANPPWKVEPTGRLDDSRSVLQRNHGESAMEGQRTARGPDAPATRFNETMANPPWKGRG